MKFFNSPTCLVAPVFGLLLVVPVADGVGGHEGDGEVAGVGEVLLGEEPLQVDHVQRVEGALGVGSFTYDVCNPLIFSIQYRVRGGRKWYPGLVNFGPADAYHFCIN